MAKDDRSAVNPFTGKKHYDKVNDDTSVMIIKIKKKV